MIGRLGLETFHDHVFYLFTKHTAIFKMFRLILNNDYSRITIYYIQSVPRIVLYNSYSNTY